MKYTVFGGSGFIGASITAFLRSQGHDVFTPSRTEQVPKNINLGHVIFAIGMTGNFRDYPFETVDAHVNALITRMKDAIYESWLYLSSTRVYGRSRDLVCEEEPVSLIPNSDSLYDISKLLGESICFSIQRAEVRVVRLSNVYGKNQSQHTFLGSLRADYLAGRSLVMREDRRSSKDYISITDLVEIVPRISVSGQHRIYNLASGKNTSHEELAKKIQEITGSQVHFCIDASPRNMSSIDITRVSQEFNFTPRTVLNDIEIVFSP